MADDRDSNQKISVSVPFGVIAAGFLVGIAVVVAYVMSNQGDTETTGTMKSTAKAGKGIGRKLALMSLITLIENDATRKGVVAVLRAMARRT